MRIRPPSGYYDWGDFMTIWVTVAIVAVCAIAIVALIYREVANPCVEYGPKRESFMQIGNTVVPTTVRDCVKRTYEEPRAYRP